MVSKIRLFKTADRILGSFASSIVLNLLKPRSKSSDINSILIIRPGGMGDAILLIPAIKALKSNFPSCRLDVLAEKRNAAVFQLCSEVDDVYLYDSFDIMRFFKNKYDTVIDTEQWHKLSSVAAYITKAPVRLGFDTNQRNKLFTNSVPYSQGDYEINSFINLANEISPQEIIFDPDKKFIEFDNCNKNNYPELQNLIDRTECTVGLFYGATVDERKWGTDKYSILTNKLLERNIGVVLLGGKTEIRDQYQVLNRIKNRENLLNYIGKTSLSKTAEIISNTDLFISSDTGLMHLAFGLGIKTLSIFGAGIQDKWAPRGKKSYVLNKYLSCSPCTSFGYTPKCLIGVKCLSDISVDEVYFKALEILEFK